MSVLIKNVTVVDPSSKWHGKTLNLFVNNKGVLEEYAAQEVKKTIDYQDAMAFPGICDLSVNFCEPGLEHKETLASGAKAAIKGGVTAVLQVPNVDPVIDTKEALAYLKHKGKKLPIDFYFQAAISKNLDCKSLTEVLDMNDCGADAFGDGYSNSWHGGLLLKALQYLQHTNKVLFNTPYDKRIAVHGQMHEGKVSTKNGLAGIPSLVETLALNRDIEILKYAGGKLHFAMISTAESAEIIKQAKKQGLQVTCGVNYFNLVANENALSDFDSNNKIVPPLRSESDRKALIKAVKDGIIDVIVSDHRPQDIDCKKLEFNYADFGKIGLQTMFISLKTHSDFSDEELIKALVVNPRKILGKDSVKIEAGEVANFFIYSKETHVLLDKEIVSLSKNTSEIGQQYSFKIKACLKDTYVYTEQ
jgi:dihydroorotase